jgi:hypothetical protein
VPQFLSGVGCTGFQGSKTWAPTMPVLFLANITAILNSNGCTWVTFQFAPADSKGKWQVDDFYVDPVKHH